MALTNSQIEPELKQPTPRSVRLQDGFALWVFRVLTAVPGLFAILMVGSAAKFTWDYVGHQVFAAEVEGQVVAKGMGEGDRRESHFVEYVYSLDGQIHSRRERVNSGVYKALNVGDSVTLQAAPWARDSARIKPSGEIPEGLGLFIGWGIAAVPSTIAGGFFWYLFYIPWSQKRLVRRGEVTKGTVRDIESGDGKGGRWYRIKYEYATRGGEPARDQTGSMVASGPAADAIKVDDAVTVVYDPQRPTRSLLYAFGHYKAVTRGVG